MKWVLAEHYSAIALAAAMLAPALAAIAVDWALRSAGRRPPR
jgi:hypothetical protein